MVDEIVPESVTQHISSVTAADDHSSLDDLLLSEPLSLERRLHPTSSVVASESTSDGATLAYTINVSPTMQHIPIILDSTLRSDTDDFQLLFQHFVLQSMPSMAPDDIDLDLFLKYTMPLVLGDDLVMRAALALSSAKFLLRACIYIQAETWGCEGPTGLPSDVEKQVANMFQLAAKLEDLDNEGGIRSQIGLIQTAFVTGLLVVPKLARLSASRGCIEDDVERAIQLAALESQIMSWQPPPGSEASDNVRRVWGLWRTGLLVHLYTSPVAQEVYQTWWREKSNAALMAAGNGRVIFSDRFASTVDSRHVIIYL
ncbi:uncharacterized protein CCOS01_00476 [Colletotrichum costaricense]|uniref:Uncharacterized protein n=1 Tax=Colletotrichum costaricense TaxID=1209916 RepID=A0AAJ0E641_9PEZI|nr:uncharacterized protein CCOS01_00476 [Colletotrichum costaricense]KAK1539162.1 hypothetical protein CCOS01_00476 [Colletotrichum costaricense]